MKNRFLFIVVFVAIAIASFPFVRGTLRQGNIQSEYKSTQIRVGGQTLEVALAISQSTKQKGLSGWKSLGLNEGMLFVFDKPDEYSFWMKDMNFPIDIIWIAEDLRIVHIKRDARPESYPEAYTSPQKARYVLEVASGFSEKNNLETGDSVEFVNLLFKK